MYAFTYCAGISRTSWPSPPSRRLHKKSIFCTKSPPLVELYVQSPHHERAAFRFGQANQSCVRSSQMLAPRILNTRPFGGYGETQPPSRADDAVGPGWNGLQQASDRARRRKIIEVRDVPRLFHHAPDRRRPSQI